MFAKLFLFLIILLVVWVISWFIPPSPTKSDKKTEETEWEEQKRQVRKEHLAEKNKEWFTAGRWLTDKEIDWTTSWMEKSEKFKILPAHQFHLVREAKRENDPLIFKELLKEINNFAGEMNNLYDYSIVEDQLIFIPINNPNFHWSLLVYEVGSKKFWHYDTLRGANWGYVKDTVYELLETLKVPKHLWGQHFLAKHKIRQNNGWECGVAVIAIIRRISSLNNQSWREQLKYGKFRMGDDLGREGEELRKEYLKEGN